MHFAVPLIGLPSPEQFALVVAALRNGLRLAQIGLRGWMKLKAAS